MKTELTEDGISFIVEDYADQLFIAEFCKKLGKKDSKYWDVELDIPFNSDPDNKNCSMGALTKQKINCLSHFWKIHIKELNYCLYID